MEKIEIIKEELKTILSEKRYLHSIGTMKMAKLLAKKHNIDEEKAALVGLLHDIAKEIPYEETLDYMQKNQIEIDEIEKISPSLLHAKIGAHLAKNKYDFTYEMSQAVKYHTTGHPDMDKLAKIIYIADKIEETRIYDEVEKVRGLAMKDLDETMLYILNYNIQKNIDKNKLIHPNSILLRNKILLHFL